MYAVIKTGGKQYRVQPGNVFKVESIEAGIGESITFNEVLMIADGDDLTIGTPTIASAKVVAEVIAHGRAKKVEIIKFKRRKHHQKRTGHRQNFTQIHILNINGKGAPYKNCHCPGFDTARLRIETKIYGEAMIVNPIGHVVRTCPGRWKPMSKTVKPTILFKSPWPQPRTQNPSNLPHAPNRFIFLTGALFPRPHRGLNNSCMATQKR